jgi:hypothetical protein
MTVLREQGFDNVAGGSGSMTASASGAKYDIKNAGAELR